MESNQFFEPKAPVMRAFYERRILVVVVMGAALIAGFFFSFLKPTGFESTMTIQFGKFGNVTVMDPLVARDQLTTAYPEVETLSAVGDSFWTIHAEETNQQTLADIRVFVQKNIIDPENSEISRKTLLAEDDIRSLKNIRTAVVSNLASMQPGSIERSFSEWRLSLLDDNIRAKEALLDHPLPAAILRESLSPIPHQVVRTTLLAGIVGFLVSFACVLFLPRKKQ